MDPEDLDAVADESDRWLVSQLADLGNERLRARLELRRSNAAAPHRNRKKYTRKVKHPKQEA